MITKSGYIDCCVYVTTDQCTILSCYLTPSDGIDEFSIGEVNVIIMQLKNNKAAGADGLPGVLFKARYKMLIRHKNPNFWNQSVLKSETLQNVKIAGLLFRTPSHMTNRCQIKQRNIFQIKQNCRVYQQRCHRQFFFGTQFGYSVWAKSIQNIKIYFNV